LVEPNVNKNINLGQNEVREEPLDQFTKTLRVKRRVTKQMRE
jgi:hypothetical protein